MYSVIFIHLTLFFKFLCLSVDDFHIQSNTLCIGKAASYFFVLAFVGGKAFFVVYVWLSVDSLHCSSYMCVHVRISSSACTHGYGCLDNCPYLTCYAPHAAFTQQALQRLLSFQCSASFGCRKPAELTAISASSKCLSLCP